MTHHSFSALAIALLGLGLAGLPQQAAANLVTNGGFEAPDITGYPYYGVGSTAMPGWTVVGNTIQQTDNAAFGAQGVVASEGSQFLDLTGNVGRGGGVKSNAIATVAGDQYRLQFDIGAFFVGGYGSFGNVIVNLWIDGVASGSFTNVLSLTSAGTDWETETVDFTASGAATVVEFRSSLSTASSDLGVGLDNVRLNQRQGGTPAPEPVSSWLVAAALAGLGLARRRATPARR